jgi:hypothetical protein
MNAETYHVCEESKSMTMPSERTTAVNNAREFLYELMDPKKTPRLPKYIRQRAHHLLRHYPSKLDMEIISDREYQDVHFVNRVFGNPEWPK